MDKLFVLAALPPWPLLLGLAISFRVYAPVAHSVPPWPLLLGFLAVLNSFQSLRCMHSFQRFGLLGFGFTIHCLLTTNTSCSIVNIILASTVARPFSGQPFFLALSFQSWRLGVFRNQSFLLRPRLACPCLPPILPLLAWDLASHFRSNYGAPAVRCMRSRVIPHASALN